MASKAKHRIRSKKTYRERQAYKNILKGVYVPVNSMLRPSLFGF